jgi:hypothetical protein
MTLILGNNAFEQAKVEEKKAHREKDQTIKSLQDQLAQVKSDLEKQ